VIAALDARGHLTEAVVKNRAVVSGLTTLVLDGMANGTDTGELDALLGLANDVGRHVEIATEIAA
jgi:hypothetical protein